MMNTVIQEDLDAIVNEQSIDWEQLKDSSVLVTGATGLVGSLLVKALAYYNKEKCGNIKILAMVRDVEKANRVLGHEVVNEGVQFVTGDIRNKIEVSHEVDYIIHGASITQSKTMVQYPVETLFTAVDGTRNMLELAREKEIKSMVYISSMEAYGITDPSKKKITEKDLGYIDNLSVRSSYPEGKRVCELTCAAYASEYGVPVKIARLAQTFGAGVPRTENRVFAQFAKSAIDGTDIVLHTKGESFGNYCYTADVVRGLLCILTKGENSEAYTLVNEETTMQIKDMAKLVANTLSSGKTKVVFDIPEDALKFGYAPDVTMHLSGEKARTLGWEPQYNLDKMYERMTKSWLEEEE